jgi:signal transduction histidine kinase
LSQPPEPTERPQVLVIEDSPEVGVLLTRTLGRSFSVKWCKTVAEAFRALKGSPPRALLSDIMLPDGTGYEVLAAVRGRRDLDEVPVLFLSALADPHERVRGLRAGASDYIAKPFSADEVCTRLNAAIARTDAHRKQIEAQREELVMEVHDGISATLARVALLLASVRSQSGADPRLAFIEQSVREALDETRVLMSVIGSTSGTWEDLVATVRRDLTDASERAGLKLTFAAKADNPPLQVSARVGHAVQRIAREALTNVLKHAHARRVHCTLEARARTLRLRVEDDGRGLPPDQPGRPAGRGLGIVSRRAKRLGGSAGVGNNPSGGAYLEATLSLDVPA